MESPQNNKSHNPQNNGKTNSQNPDDKPTIGLSILSFFIPLVGFILAAINWKSKPISAKRYLIISGIAVAFCIFANIVNPDKQSTSNSSGITASNSGGITQEAAAKSKSIKNYPNCKHDIAVVFTKFTDFGRPSRDLETIEKICKRYRSDVNCKFPYKADFTSGEFTTPLENTMKVMKNDPVTESMVKALINAGADVNEKYDLNITPLHVSLSYANPGTTKALIAAGADVNAKDDNGNTPLMEFNSSDPIFAANVKILIAAGADVNAKNKYGDSVLIYLLSLHDNVEVVKALIAAGADVNAKNDKGETPLMKTYSGEVAKILIDSGADVNAKNNNGKTALDIAEENKKTKVANVIRSSTKQ